MIKLKKLRIQRHQHVIKDLNGENFFAIFHEKELQKTKQSIFRVENWIKKKGNRLFNSWINASDVLYNE